MSASWHLISFMVLLEWFWRRLVKEFMFIYFGDYCIIWERIGSRLFRLGLFCFCGYRCWLIFWNLMLRWIGLRFVRVLFILFCWGFVVFCRRLFKSCFVIFFKTYSKMLRKTFFGNHYFYCVFFLGLKRLLINLNYFEFFLMILNYYFLDAIL